MALYKCPLNDFTGTESEVLAHIEVTRRNEMESSARAGVNDHFGHRHAGPPKIVVSSTTNSDSVTPQDQTQGPGGTSMDQGSTRTYYPGGASQGPGGHTMNNNSGSATSSPGPRDQTQGPGGTSMNGGQASASSGQTSGGDSSGLGNVFGVNFPAGDPEQEPTYIPERGVDSRNSTRVQGSFGPTAAQRAEQQRQRLESALQAAAAGDASQLHSYDLTYNVSRDPNEYKKAFYTDYTHEDLSAATSAQLKDWFIAKDANNDGQISQNEVSTEAWDKVGSYAGDDGQLSVGEGVSYHRGQIGDIGEKLRSSGLNEDSQRQIWQWFHGKDTNNDGTVSSDEIDQNVGADNQRLVKQVAGDDESLSVDEAIEYHLGRQSGMLESLDESTLSDAKKEEIAHWFTGKDANQDGVVSRGEAAGAFGQVSEAAGADGELTAEEVVAHHEQKADFESKLAQSGLPDATQNEIRSWWSSKDANRDGSISKNEAGVQAWSLQTDDSQQDGQLTVDEVIAYHKDLQSGFDTSLAASGLSSAKQQEIRDWFAQHDSNKDGRVSTSEAPNAFNQVSVAAGQDGAITHKESIAYHQQKADFDKKLSQSGLVNTKKQEIKDWFAAKDANRDGYVQRSEMSAAAWNQQTAAAKADGKIDVDEAITHHKIAGATIGTGTEPNTTATTTTTTTAAPQPNPIDAKLAASSLSDTKKQEIKSWFAAKDSNKDNKIQRSESAATFGTISEAAASDGVLTADEAIAYHEQKEYEAQQLASSGLPADKQKEIKDFFADKDANRDGSIQKTETSQAVWDQLSTGAKADGKLSTHEAVDFHRGKIGLAPKGLIGKAPSSWGGASASTGAESLAAPTIVPASSASGAAGLPGSR